MLIKFNVEYTNNLIHKEKENMINQEKVILKLDNDVLEQQVIAKAINKSIIKLKV